MQAHIKYAPFKDTDEDQLQTVSLVSTVFVLVAGIMLKAAAEGAVSSNPSMDKYNHPPPGLMLFLCACTTVIGVVTALMKMWKTLQRDLALTSLAGGRAKLYCTPGGVNLSVQTKEM